MHIMYTPSQIAQKLRKNLAFVFVYLVKIIPNFFSASFSYTPFTVKTFLFFLPKIGYVISVQAA